VAASSHRRALGALFLVLAIALAGVSWTAAAADQWIIAAAAGVIAFWLAVMAIRALRP
jgi:hypothetical protein